jgi:hypothetical protein
LVNRRYYQELKSGPHDKTSRAWLSECLASANWLVKALDQRARTIVKVVSEIVRRQHGFFERGVSALKPLTLREVAEAIEMHVTASWASYRYSAPQSYSPKNPFNVIFSQILPNSADPDAALAELGLDGSYRRWNGAQAYTPGVRMDDPMFYQPFAERTGFGKIALFYLRHPADAWKALAGSLDEAGRFQSPLGNFDSDSGKPPAAHYESFQWASGLKRRLFHHRGGLLCGACLALAAVTGGAFLANRRRLPNGAVSGVVALAAASVTMLVVSALGDVYDQFRHQLVTFAMFDMLVVALAWLLVLIYPGYRAHVSRQ